MFPLLELAVQEAHTHARGARQCQRGQYGVDPHVVDHDLVVHESPVDVDGSVRAVPLTTAAQHRGGSHGYGGGPGRGDCSRHDRGSSDQRRRFHERSVYWLLRGNGVLLKNCG